MIRPTVVSMRSPALRSRKHRGLAVERLLDSVVREPHEYTCLQVEIRAVVVGKKRIARGHERPTLARSTITHGGQVVETDDHVLRRHGQRATVCRRLDVVGGEHEDTGLGLRLSRQRQVDRHLVAVEVCVERGADERVQADGLTLDEDRLERLDAEAVQGRRAVEHDGVVPDDLFEHVPHDALATVDHALGALDVLRVVQVDQALHDERLEQLERHDLRQTRTGGA